MDGGKGPRLKDFLSGSLATWVRGQVGGVWEREVSSREGLVLLGLEEGQAEPGWGGLGCWC